METLVLNVENRTETGSKLALLRASKRVPAVIYGHGFAPKLIAIDGKLMGKTLQGAGESTILDVVIAGDKQPVKALIQDVQRDPISDVIIHVDFRAIRMDEKLKVEIPFEFVGESAAVKGMGGTLVKNLEHVEVLCLPGALVKSFKIDLGALKTFEDKIRVHDIKLPEGMELTAKTDEVIALVAPPRSDEEMAALDKAVDLDASKVEVVKKEKKAEEGEEGAAAAEAKPGEAKPAEGKKEEKKK